VALILHNLQAMKKTILIVDDEADIRQILSFNIGNAGYQVEESPSAEEAMDILAEKDIDLILLDVMLPGISGYKLAENLRANGNNVPIIFLTALGSERNLIAGFDSGGDDYVSKPFSIKELLARVEAVLRRSPSVCKDTIITCGQLVIDTVSKEVLINGEKLKLTHKEFEILKVLAENPGRCFSRADIIAMLWKDAPYVTERTVDVHIARIRAKMGDARELLKNKSGFGYYLDENGLQA